MEKYSIELYILVQQKKKIWTLKNYDETTFMSKEIELEFNESILTRSTF